MNIHSQVPEGLERGKSGFSMSEVPPGVSTADKRTGYPVGRPVAVFPAAASDAGFGIGMSIGVYWRPAEKLKLYTFMV